MSTVERRKLVESFVVSSLYPDDEIKRIGEELGTKHFAVLARATMAVALARAFPRTPSRLQIAGYAHYLANRYRSGEIAAEARVADALIRANFGELGLLGDLRLEQIVPHEMLIAYDIFAGLDLDEAGLDAFVDEALELAEDAMRASTGPWTTITSLRQEVAVGTGRVALAVEGLRDAVTHLTKATTLLADTRDGHAGKAHQTLVQVQSDVADLAGRLEAASGTATAWADAL